MTNSNIILLVDDDPDDVLLFKDAAEDTEPSVTIIDVGDAEAALEYLRDSGIGKSNPTPRLIISDFNLPGMNAPAFLDALRAENLGHLNVVVMSGTTDPVAIAGLYERGARSFIKKPPTFGELIELTRIMVEYWFGAVHVPM